MTCPKSRYTFRPPLNLALFDIDGTLTRTNRVDARAFNAAFVEVLGVGDLDGTWDSYEHRTDSSIADGICRRHLGRRGTEEEMIAVRRRFVDLLLEEARRDAAQFVPVAGAREFLESLVGRGWAVGLATGGWGASARLKLERAGLDLGLPMATADDAMPRHEIVSLAARRVKAAHGVTDFDKVVSVGDGTWDLEVARDLGLAFVGVTAESDAAALRAAGADHLLFDYSDPENAHATLEVASIPGRVKEAKP